MSSLLDQKNNHNLKGNFFRLNENQKNFRKKPYIDLLSTLFKIFDIYGKTNILPLLKLRKIWNIKLDKFITNNAYPRNISKQKKIFLNSNLLSELKGSKLKHDLYSKIEKNIGKNFGNYEQFFGYLRKDFGRSITKDEIEILKNKVKFNDLQLILHLTVYDGSVSYAINSEKVRYINLLNRLLPELNIDDIRCHVGQIEKINLDQKLVASLAKDWHFITPNEINQKCMPAFLHRVSNNHSILIIYVTNKKDLDFLDENMRLDELLNNLKENFSEMQNVLKIRSVIFPGADFEKIKANAIILGESSNGIPFNDKKLSYNYKSSFLEDSISAKENFAKISRKLKN